MKSNDLDARNQGANENKLKNKFTFIDRKWHQLLTSMIFTVGFLTYFEHNVFKIFVG